MPKQPEDLKTSRNSSTMMPSKLKLSYIFAIFPMNSAKVTVQIFMEMPLYSIDRFTKMVHPSIPLKVYMEKELVVSYIFYCKIDWFLWKLISRPRFESNQLHSFLYFWRNFSNLDFTIKKIRNVKLNSRKSVKYFDFNHHLLLNYSSILNKRACTFSFSKGPLSGLYALLETYLVNKVTICTFTH